MTEHTLLFKRYGVVRLLGRGGVGSVYLVEDLQDRHKLLALKMIELPDEQSFDMIRGEFEILAKYRHPHLARAFDLGREGHLAYFTMEYVSGTDLLDAAGLLDRPEILRLSIQALRALAFVHDLGLVHGDIKPQNILVDTSGARPAARLLDFGLAETLLDAGESVPTSSGTPGYFPPEKAMGAPPDPRSDLYSFGVTLFQTLTGRFPFQGANPGEVLEKHRFSPPPPPSSLDGSIPPALDAVCLRLMEKEPRRRFPNAEAVIMAMAPLVHGMEEEKTETQGRHLVSAVFSGRQEQLAALEKGLGRTLAGTSPPTVSIVRGSAGIGKSRLAGEYALDVRARGCRVIEIACGVNEIDALSPLFELARTLAGFGETSGIVSNDPMRTGPEEEGGLEEEPSNPAEVSRLSSEIRSLLTRASEAHPLLLVVEDFHRAEPHLIDALGELLAGDLNGRWAVILVARSRFENPLSAKNFTVLERRARFPEISIGPLGAGDVKQWVADALPGAILDDGTAGEILRMSGGNPLLIREILSTAVEEGRILRSTKGWSLEPRPEGEAFLPAAYLTESRFESLPELERGILSALALNREALPADVIARYLGVADQGLLHPLLRRLSQAGWIVSSRGGKNCSLHNDSLRRPILRVMGGTPRKKGHRDLARILAGKGRRDDAIVPIVAEHWMRSGSHEESVRWCLDAGQAFLRQRRFRPAQRFLRAARRAAKVSKKDTETMARIDLSMGFSILGLGNNKRAEEFFRMLSLGDLPPLLQARCWFFLGQSLTRQFRHAQALEAFSRAEGILEENGRSTKARGLLLRRSEILNILGRYGEAAESVRHLVKIDRTSLQHGVGALYETAWSCAEQGRLDEALDHVRVAFGICVKSNQPSRRLDLCKLYHLVSHCRFLHGDMRKAVKWVELSLQGYLGEGNRYGKAMAMASRGSLFYRMGNPSGARDDLKEAGEAYRAEGAVAAGAASDLDLARLDLDAARYGPLLDTLDSIERSLSGLDVDSTPLLQMLHGVRARFFLRVGDPEKASKSLEAIRGAFHEGNVDFRTETTLTRIACLLGAGRPGEAMEEAEGLDCESRVVLVSRSRIHLALARASATLGRNKDAGEWIRSAKLTVEKSGLSGYLPEILLFESCWSLSAGEPGRAVAAAFDAFERSREAGKVHLLWKSQRRIGVALENNNAKGRAGKHFRRAAWYLEAELTSLPEPYRQDFLHAEDASDLFARAVVLRSEDTATRLARMLARKEMDSHDSWNDAALAWGESCSGFFGADAVAFHSPGDGPCEEEAVIGKRRGSDTRWTVDVGGKESRKCTITFFRRCERGAFLPVVKRAGRVLLDRLSDLFAGIERLALERRLSLVNRRLLDRAESAETALMTARRAISRTQTALDQEGGFEEIVGETESMRSVIRQVRRWGPTDMTVLVSGESGTGKELVARALHEASKRKNGLFTAVNCAALAESLLESELFGHEKGAFTGADETKPGLFELAHEGTLVLDEIADMNPRMQVMLLRVLEQREVRRLGGTRSIPVDVRVIALSNRRLENEVKAGRFRGDLYYRLIEVEIEIPPLRKRKEDIPLLAEHFLATLRTGKRRKSVSSKAVALLMKYRWNGNVRELRNVLQRASILSNNQVLKPKDFPELGAHRLTKSSMSEGLLAVVRREASKEGIPLDPRHEDLFRVLAATGSIRRAEYEQIAGISTRTATRDFKRFLSLGLIRKRGRNKATVYTLAEGLESRRG